MQLSVVVCTYNRCDLLEHCLDSLEKQTSEKGLFEVIIIDNNSRDDTKQIVQKFTDRNPHFKYIFEGKQGLGYSRNRGYKESKYDWVAYVDDDAIIHSNYVERALWIISNYPFDCFGGVYNAWYTVKRPKWISDDFGTNRSKQKETGELKDRYMDGGNMVWKKSILEQLGGFATEIGMKGGNISYGEETYIQQLAKEKGFIIGFDPELQIDHYVQPYKLSVKWLLKSNFATGRDYWKTFNLEPTQKDKSLRTRIYIIKELIKGACINIKKLFSKQPYYYQNYLLDTLGPFYFQMGRLKGTYKKEVN